MVKAYLRYVREDAFGLIASPKGNVSFLVSSLPSAVDPTAAAASDGATFQSALVPVKTAAHNLPQSQQLALSCCGAAVVLWNLSQQRPHLYFSPHQPPSSAGAAVVSGATGTSCLYYATRIAVSSRSTYLAVGYSDGSIRIWALPAAAAAADTAASVAATAASCGPDSHAARAAAAALYPLPLLTFYGHHSAITCLLWADDLEGVEATYLLSGGGDGEVLLWDRVAGTGISRLKAHAAPITALQALSPTFASPVSASDIINDADFALGNVGNSATAVSSAEKLVAGAVGLHAVSTATPNGLKKNSVAQRIYCSNRSSGKGEGLLLITGAKDGLVKLWDVQLQVCLQVLVEAAITAAPIAAAGRRGSASAAAGGQEVWSLAVNAAQTRLVVGCSDHLLRVYKLHRGRYGMLPLTAVEATSADCPGASKFTAAAVDEETGLPKIAFFFGILQRVSGGGRSKRRTTSLQFLPLQQVAAEAAAPEAYISVETRAVQATAMRAAFEEKEEVLVVGSGGACSVEIYRVCGVQETRRRMRRRRRRQQEKQRKREHQGLAASAASSSSSRGLDGSIIVSCGNSLSSKKGEAGESLDGKKEEIGEDENANTLVSDQFIFLCRLHTNSVIKSFDLRCVRVHAAKSQSSAANSDFTSLAAIPKSPRRKKKKKRQLQQSEEEELSEVVQHHCMQMLQLEILLGLADNAIELWRVDVHSLSMQSGGIAKISVADGSGEVSASGDAVHQQLVVGNDLATEAAIQLIHRVAQCGHRATIRQLTVSRDSSLLLSVADEGLKLWAAHSRRCVKTLPMEKPLCAFFVAGNEHVVVGFRSGELLLYNVAACAVQQRLIHVHTSAINALAEHPQRTGFASVSADKTLKLFVFSLEEDSSCSASSSSVSKKQKKKQQEEDCGDWQHSTATEERRSRGGSIRMRQVGSMELPDEGVAVEYTMNGKLLICALLDMTMLVFYADSRKVFLSLYGHQLPILSIAVSSDSTLLASGAADKTVKLWGLDFGNIQQSLLAHEEAVTQVLFLSQTHYLVSASEDGSVKLWDADKKHCLICILPSSDNSSAVTCLTATDDGERLFAAQSSRLLQCWRRSEQQLFIEEEQQQRWEAAVEHDALREDTLLGSTAVSPQIVLARASKRSMESVRTTEKLMEVLDEAREQQALDEAYDEALQKWREQQRKSRIAGVEKSAIPPPPVAPPAKPELMGRSAAEHVLRAVSTIRSCDAFEVLVATPFDYAYRLLEFLLARLAAYWSFSVTAQQQLLELDQQLLSEAQEASAASGKLKKKCKRTVKAKSALPSSGSGNKTTDGGAVAADETLGCCLCPIEAISRIVLVIVQLHFRVFLASPSLRPILGKLQACLRPLLLQERDRLRFNRAACTLLERGLNMGELLFSSPFE